MAQMVGYMDDNIRYESGPFVVVRVPDPNRMGAWLGWRIESEHKNFPHPVLPHRSIFGILQKYGLGNRTREKHKAELMCDYLNDLVRRRKIVVMRSEWVAR